MNRTIRITIDLPVCETFPEYQHLDNERLTERVREYIRDENSNIIARFLDEIFDPGFEIEIVEGK